MTANAWITSATALHLIHKLATDCTQYCKFDYYFVPQINPDGYEYSKNTNASWVKSRCLLNPLNPCYGVSINHNFETPENSDNAGGSSYCDDDNYYGTVTTPEAIALSSSRQLPGHIVAAFSLNSYGEKILYPFARINYIEITNRQFDPLDLIKYIRPADDFTIAAQSIGGGNAWEYEAYSNVFQVQDGTSMDQCLAVDCADYSYTLFLRNSSTGSNPDASEIMTSAAEVLAGMYALVDRITIQDDVELDD